MLQYASSPIPSVFIFAIYESTLRLMENDNESEGEQQSQQYECQRKSGFHHAEEKQE